MRTSNGIPRTRFGNISRRGKGRLLAAAIVITVLALLAVLFRSSLQKQGERGDTLGTSSGSRPLPEDVEGVLTSFSYSEADQQVRIKISGKRVVRRGRRLLGLRSNLVKTNFIEEIRGTVTSAQGTSSFAAAQAEWDGESSRPLLLQEGVSLTVCGRPLAQVKQARIYLKSGLIATADGKTYLMK